MLLPGAAPAPVSRGALDPAWRPPAPLRTWRCERAGRGLQPARHLCARRTLLAVALGTAGGFPSGAAHRPQSAVGA